MAPGVGVAFNTKKASNTSLFAEVEFNKWFGRKGFIGTGVGVWDFTDGDTVAPTWASSSASRCGPPAERIRTSSTSS